MEAKKVKTLRTTTYFSWSGATINGILQQYYKQSGEPQKCELNKDGYSRMAIFEADLYSDGSLRDIRWVNVPSDITGEDVVEMSVGEGTIQIRMD